MPVLETAAEAIGSAVIELLYWGSIRPQGACAIAATSLAIASAVRLDLPVGWPLGSALTFLAAVAGYGVGYGLNQQFRTNRPARIAICVMAACITIGSFGWLIFGG